MKNILIVEDDKAILRGLRENFRREGYRVLVESDGSRGYATARSEQPNLVILDVMLPSMTGFEICSKLKGEGFGSPIFLLTGLSQEQSKLEGLSYGADDYISKPFSIRELTLRVRNALKQHEQVQARSKTLEEEFQKARKIQLSSLPKGSLKVRGLNLFGRTLPATQVGGDYFDYFRIGKGKIGVVVADVSGKGMPAALYVQKMQGIVQSSKKSVRSAAEILITLQEHLHSTMEAGSFVTAVAAVFDIEHWTAEIAQAGHLPVLLKRKKKIRMVKPPGVWIGKSSQELFIKGLQLETVKLERGDTFLFYTDGVLEARGKKGREYGLSRLMKVLRQGKGTAKEITNRCFEEVGDFSGDCVQADDITVLSVVVSA
ncbi:MAG: SpoIIE family protein phosphatase [Bacteroidota bacterium]